LTPTLIGRQRAEEHQKRSDAVIVSGLFEVYRGERIPEGTRSLALSLTFRSPERTLTDEEVDEIVARIVHGLEEIGARLRT